MIDLSRLQLLSFEVGSTCDLANKHPFCPVNRADRYRRCDDLRPAEDWHFVAFARTCQQVGFRGHVAFHYYNEPLLAGGRVLRLAQVLSQTGLRSALWTNGTHLTPDADLTVFDRVFITEHDPGRAGIYEAVKARHPRVTMQRATYDDRIKIYDQAPGAMGKACWRPRHIELVVDFFGEVHLCCGDWRAERAIGNVQRDAPGVVLLRWEQARGEAEAGTPEVCRKCQTLVLSPFLGDGGFVL